MTLRSRVALATVAGLAALAITFGVAFFVNWNFDPGSWNAADRFFTAYMALTLGAGSFALTLLCTSEA